MNRLITLSGPKNDFGMADILELDDLGAGFIIASKLVNQNPNIRWSDLKTLALTKAGLGNGFMGKKWYEKAASWVGGATSDFIDVTGDVLGSVVDKTGEVLGSTVRLGSDPEVADTISRAVTAYGSGGSSEGARSVLSELGNVFKGVFSADKSASGKTEIATTGALGSIPAPVLWIAGGLIGLSLFKLMFGNPGRK